MENFEVIKFDIKQMRLEMTNELRSNEAEFR